jgi:hypothetical protein
MKLLKNVQYEPRAQIGAEPWDREYNAFLGDLEVTDGVKQAAEEDQPLYVEFEHGGVIYRGWALIESLNDQTASLKGHDPVAWRLA